MKITSVAVSVLVVCLVQYAAGQQINLNSPFNSASNSFHERMGVNFGFSLRGGGLHGHGSRVVGLLPNGQLSPNITFGQGSSAATIPAFRGYDPNSSARFGFGVRSTDGSGFSLGFDFSQGSTRTLSSTSPSITLQNGGIGYFGSGSVSPFVTGVTPVVGQEYVPDNAVTRGISSGQLRPFSRETTSRGKPATDYQPQTNANSSAAQGDLSVAEIKAQKARAARAKQADLQASLENARTAEAQSDFRDARKYIRAAIKLTDDKTEKRSLREWLNTLRDKN
jgi:hypothetical protein